DLSLHGNTDLSTPHIDSLARDGAQFTHFYVCPVCSPTRAEFLTGRHHPRSGVYSTSAGGERMNLDEMTIANAFQDAGYATGAFGKWHNGMQFPYHPNGRGFQEFYGFCSGHWGDYFSPPLEHNGALVQGEGFVVDDFTSKAIEFIRENQENPFFVYLPYNTPHSPMQVPDKYWDRFKSKTLDLQNREPNKEDDLHKRCALAMCENIDDNVGRILAALDELSLAENTIVLFFHDNGPNGWRWNGGMKGRKGSTDEGGVRSPLLLRWPASVAPGMIIRPIASVRDLLPTLTDLAGISFSPEKPLDGISLRPLLENPGNNTWTERTLVSHWKGKTSARNQRFRLGHQGQLFDLLKDPYQQINVAAEHPSVVNALSSAIDTYRADVASLLGEDTRTFPIAHPEFPHTQIPARDGLAHGGIKRSNKFPNCSYFQNWTSLDDKITWEVDVLSEGEFQVDLQYACPDADAGSAFALTLGDSILRFSLEAHDVPERGAENDRSPRSESYVKDFRTVTLGTLALKKGPDTLTLQATEIPGETAMEFRLLQLTRL
ncbi:MAG: arylsulfatase, partial [Verrucomicrobiota bacterium]